MQRVTANTDIKTSENSLALDNTDVMDTKITAENIDEIISTSFTK